MPALQTSELGVGTLGLFLLGGPDVVSLLPNGVARYFGLFEVLPDNAGVGGVEGPESRVAVDRWTWLTEDIRTNAEPIRITVANGHPVAGWGIWDAPTAGTLVAFIPFSPDGVTDVVDYANSGDTAEIEGLGIAATASHLAAASNLNSEDYSQPAVQLLPRGPAWTGPRLHSFLGRVARELSRVEWRASRLIEEADPRTTQELLGDWEAFAALPDCGAVPETVAGRQAVLVAKLTQNLSPRAATFIAIAEALGYTGVQVVHNADPFTCISNCNDSLYGGPWIFTWTLVVDASSDNDAALECLVRKLTPQHTQVLFQYGP